MNNALISPLIVLLLAGSACAQTYYADITVYVDASGMAELSGVTNHPQLSAQKTAALTSKIGSVWTFNLTLPEGDVFSDYIYAVKLPAGSSINYVRAESFRISESGGLLTVSGSAQKRPFGIVIQYQIQEKQSSSYDKYVLAALGFLLLSVLAYQFLGKKEKHAAGPASLEHATPKYLKYENVLSERHKDILRILKEEGRPVNQATLCKRLDLPKSSVSRNVATLYELGLIDKTRIGMSTFLSLRKE